MYPKTKLYISLLLPTKDTSLNYRVDELNKCIKHTAANSNGIFVVEHNNLMDQYGFLDPLLGRLKRGIPNPDDLIHLGPSGLKRIIRNFKDSILHKKSPFVNRRYNTSLPHSRTTETPDLPHRLLGDLPLESLLALLGYLSYPTHDFQDLPTKDHSLTLHLVLGDISLILLGLILSSLG